MYIFGRRRRVRTGRYAEAAAKAVETRKPGQRADGTDDLHMVDPGNVTSFVMPVVGEFGAVGWTTQLPDLPALEATQATLRASDEWLKLADRAGHAYQPGVITSLMRRLS